jgi:16S rRNA (guanine527-N7)-methyltransferase
MVTMRELDRPLLTAKLREGVGSMALTLSEAQLGMLIDYVSLLSKWNAVYNLTAVRDPVQMITQHVLDSLAAVPAFVDAQNVLDVGAGGGLPGMVLAIWASEARPELRVSMIDTVHKKTAFLTQAKVELGLTNVSIFTMKVEQLRVSEPFDVITSRAFAELADFVNWSGHLLAPGGRFIAMKGVRPEQEIAALPAGWTTTSVQAIKVPGMDAERHLVFMARAAQ